MRIFKFTFLTTLFFYFIAKSQGPNTEWQKSLGGTYIERVPDIHQTADGGYIVAGSSNSINGDVTGNHGNSDVWIVKLNPAGSIQWQKSLGGSAADRAFSVRQTSDGGYIIAGTTESNNGDVTGNHGNSDAWIVKLDATGNLNWQKAFGGTDIDIAKCVRQTSDGGYIIAGSTASSNGDISSNHGATDYWIIKLTSNGVLQWQKSLGGGSGDEANSIEQTTDGGYIVAGYTNSIDGDVTGNHGLGDYWVVKLNSTGNIQWQKALGGSNTDNANSIKQTPDGGYIVAGQSISTDGDITGNNGNIDYWIVKLNSAGNMEWEKSYGGSLYDVASDIKNTNDGGYIVIGYSHFFTEGNFGTNDYWLLKLDSTGNLEWQKSFGGPTDDYATAVQQTADGGYILCGYSDAITGSPGDYNFWIIKLEGNLLSTKENTVSDTPFLYPNPAKDFVYIDHLPKETTISITDLSGRKLFSQKYKQEKVKMDTSDLINGVYIVQAENNGKNILTEKLIISQ